MTLGERIRAIRKQHKLTLEQCAGEQMTKGMLSLIENNKANPSMENLKYLAARLDVEVAELLEEMPVREIQELLVLAEQYFLSGGKSDYALAVKLIDPVLLKLTKGYEAARLLEIYGRSAYRIKMPDWQTWIEKAGDLYREIAIIPRQAAVGVFLASVRFEKHHYEDALSYLLEVKEEVEARNGYVDALTRLDLDTHEVIFRFAVNDTVEATRVMERAIAFSRENFIFYQTGQLYRLASYRALVERNDEKLNYYERKLQQYGLFAEDDHELWFMEMTRVHQLNSYQQDFTSALQKLDEIQQPPSEKDYFLHFYLLERGKAFYGLGQFEEALKLLKQVVISEHLHHPFDLAIYYEKDAYAALCAVELGDLPEAKRMAAEAVRNMATMPDSPYKKFVFDTKETVDRL